MIHIKNISKKFGKLRVLKNINLFCDTGECIALIGPNGCGKTTLIKTILGMVLPDEGNILVNGYNIKNDFAYRCHIGYMPQIGRYPENMKVGQVIATIQHLRQSKKPMDNELIEQYKLTQIFNKPMRTLSGGTTQKVSAALAFLFDPEILILDEPTAGLDPLAAEILKDKILKEKEKGKLILITSHQLSELDELISQIIFMQDGQVLFHKNTDLLKEETDEYKLTKAISAILKLQKV